MEGAGEEVCKGRGRGRGKRGENPWGTVGVDGFANIYP